MDDHTRCAVCYEVATSDCHLLTCSHAKDFCAECIAEWARCSTNQNCPVCRHPFAPPVPIVGNAMIIDMVLQDVVHLVN